VLALCDRLGQPVHLVGHSFGGSVALLASACTHWRFHAIPEGDHMAPLTRPDMVNPVVRAFLDESPA